MTFSDACVGLVKQFEGCRLEAYADLGGVETIGYGHTGFVVVGQTITQEQAEVLLRQDLGRAAAATSFVTGEIPQHQFDAIVSLVYNVGSVALHSTLIRKLKAGDILGAADEFCRWNHVGKEVVLGLTLRREAERELFLSPQVT